jgi:hypothetical protein
MKSGDATPKGDLTLMCKQHGLCHFWEILKFKLPTWLPLDCGRAEHPVAPNFISGELDLPQKSISL